MDSRRVLRASFANLEASAAAAGVRALWWPSSEAIDRIAMRLQRLAMAFRKGERQKEVKLASTLLNLTKTRSLFFEKEELNAPRLAHARGGLGDHRGRHRVRPRVAGRREGGAARRSAPRRPAAGGEAGGEVDGGWKRRSEIERRRKERKKTSEASKKPNCKNKKPPEHRIAMSHRERERESSSRQKNIHRSAKQKQRKKVQKRI